MEERKNRVIYNRHPMEILWIRNKKTMAVACFSRNIGKQHIYYISWE